jgi:hypothetical protein
MLKGLNTGNVDAASPAIMRSVGYIPRTLRMRGIGAQSHPAARSRFAIGLAVAIIEQRAGRLGLMILLPRIFTHTRPEVVPAPGIPIQSCCQQNGSSKTQDRQR